MGERVIRELDLSDRRVVRELLELQEASYAVEARITGSSAIPPLRDTADTLGRHGETFHGRFSGERLVGAVSYKKEDGVVDIHRLMVHPDHFRRGVARSLMRYVEQIAGTAGRIIVSTGTKNAPAVRLYRSVGFEERRETEAALGLRLTSFEKIL